MKRSGFTMIELIFVIVILGILAAVAIPKLAATRDDAQASKIATNAKTMVGEFAAYATSQGNVPIGDDNMTLASNTYVENKTSGYMSTASVDGNISIYNKVGGESCLKVDVNSTTISTVHDQNTSAICIAVQGMIPAGVVQIAGTGVLR
jgi:general secretion pathway protein G